MTTSPTGAGSARRVQRTADEDRPSGVLPQGQSLFKEGGNAYRLWIIRTGNVSLDLHVPAHRQVVVEALTHDQLVGWSWLFFPHP
jgi:CRP-like cAMP-binding protein